MTKHFSVLLISILSSFFALAGCGKSEEQKKKDAQVAAAKAFAEAFTKLGEATQETQKVEEDKLAKRSIKLGETISLGSLELAPVSVELRKVAVKPLFGDELEQKGPFLVLTVRAKNISEGQVFKPFMTAEVQDNFGNELDDGVDLLETGMIEGNDAVKEISPGETGMVLLCKSVKISKATSYRWDVSSNVDNNDTFEPWRCSIDVSEIKVVGTSK